jgi:hypothetical protein
MTVTNRLITRNHLSDEFDELVNAGVNPGGLRLWSGTDADGTLLAEFEFNAIAFGASAVGVITLAGVPIATVGLAAGTCQSADIAQDMDGTPVPLIDFDEGDELTMTNPVIAVAQDLSLVSLTYTTPAT